MLPIEIKSLVYEYAWGIPYQKLSKDIEKVIFDFTWGCEFWEIFEFWEHCRDYDIQQEQLWGNPEKPNVMSLSFTKWAKRPERTAAYACAYPHGIKDLR